MANPILARFPWSTRYVLAGFWGQSSAKASGMYRPFLDALARAKPGLDMSANEREACARRFFALQSINTLDAEQIRDHRLEVYAPYVRLRGSQVLEHAIEQKRGVIIITSHFGRMGIHGPAFALHRLRAGLLTGTVDDRNPRLASFERCTARRNAEGIRSFLGGEWMMTADHPRRLVKYLRAGNAVFIVLDAFDSNSSEHYLAPFLGGVIRIPLSLVRLARMSNARLVFSLARHVGVANVDVEISDLNPCPDRALREAITHLERAVLDQPWQWWMWPHLDHFWKINRQAWEQDPAPKANEAARPDAEPNES